MKRINRNTGRTWFKKGMIPWNKGIPMSEETKTKMIQKRIGQNMGSSNHNWKGGQTKYRGYVYIIVKDHPHVNKTGYIKRSRYNMEQFLGRILKKTEIVHHINKIKDDDHIGNLKLFINDSEHHKYHQKHNHITP